MAQFDITAVFKVSGLAQLNASFKRIGAAAGGVGRNLNRFGNDAARFGRNIAVIGTATGAALAGASIRFSEFQKDFSNVITLLDDSSFGAGNLTKGIEALESGVLSLRSTSAQSFETLNKGLFDIVSAGIPAAKALETLGIATNLALAGATDTAVAVDGITTALGAFGERAGTAEEIAQKFFTAQKAGKTTVEELAGSVGLVASQAAAAGISFDELLSTISSATVSGIRTKAAFTGLRGAIDNIQKPTGAAAAEAENLGIEFSSAALRSKGLIGVLKSVSESANFTKDSFVRLFGSVEARNFALALANDGFERANDILGSVSDSTERATNFNNALTEQQNTLSFASKQLLGTFDKLAVQIGGKLAPAFIQFFGVIRDLITEFEPEILSFFSNLGDRLLAFTLNLRNNFPAVVKTIRETLAGIKVGFDAFISSVKIAFAVISPFFKAVIKGVDDLAKALGLNNAVVLLTIVGFLKFTGLLRLMFSGATLLISVIGLLSTVMRAALIPTLGLIAGGITKAIVGIGRFVKSIFLLRFAFIAEAAAAALAWVATLGPILLAIALFAAVAAAVFVLVDAFIGWDVVIKRVGEALKVTFEFGKELVVGLTNLFVDFVKFLALIPAKIVGFFNPQLGEEMTANILASFTRLGERITGIFTSVVDFVKNAFTSIKSFFTGAQEQIKDTQEQIKKITSPTSVGTAIPRFASGGAVSGPGGPRSDSILAKLSDGEYVMNARSVQKFGTGIFDMLNGGVFPAMRGFADGGLVEAISSSTSRIGSSTLIPKLNASSGSPVKTGRPLNLILPSGEVIRTTTDENTAEKLQKNLRRADSVKSSQLPQWY